MPDLPTDLLERYVAGAATPDEQRALAARAVHDQELFDLLATVGLARASFDRTGASPMPHVARRSLRATYLMAGGLAAAAAIVAVVLPRWVRPATDPITGPTTGPTAVAAAPAPSTTGPASVTELPRPAFLAARLELPVSDGPRAVFRTSPSERRAARATGTIVTIEDGQAMLDLGAIDGLARGRVLLVEADAAAARPAARATVTTVFRDRARADVTSDVHPGQRVRVRPTDHLRALSEQIADAAAAGDAEVVRLAASRASVVARTDEPRTDVRRVVLMQLGALARSRGDGEAAAGYLREALALAAVAPAASAEERAELLNALATIAAGRGDLPAADDLLRQAERAAAPGSAVAAQLLNNRGALAAIRGDHAGAAASYRLALAALPAGDRRRRATVERNLTLLEPRP